MARLPSSFRKRNRTSRKFRESYASLPTDIKEAVRVACIRFNDNPAHRSLRYHRLKETKKGRHLPNSFSVSINMQYRAIHIIKNGINIWYWIGPHAEYDKFTGGSG